MKESNKLMGLNKDELSTLYYSFVWYRDNICNGSAKISVIKFYEKYGIRGVMK